MTSKDVVIRMAALRARAIALMALEQTPESNADYGDIFRQMCEMMYGRPVEQLTYEELVAVQRALQEPAEQPVHTIDLEMENGVPTQQSTLSKWLTRKTGE